MPKGLPQFLLFTGLLVLIWGLGWIFVYPNLGEELWLMKLNGRLPVAIIYTSISIFSVFSTLLLVINLKSWLKLLGYFTLTICTFLCISSVILTQEEIVSESWSLALNNTDSKTLISVFLNYCSPLAISLVLTGIYVYLHQVAEKFIVKMNRLWIVGLIFIISLLVSRFTLNYSNSIKDDYHPIQKIVTTYEYYKNYPIYSGSRNVLGLPKYRTQISEDTSHVWLVVDESIRFDAFAKTWTSLSQEIKPSHSYSLQKEIVSGAICSDYANALLIVGMGPSQLPDNDYQALRKPTIFAYAKAAGYATAWINTYGEHSGPYGFINESAIQDIDTILTLENINPKPNPYEYDLVLLKNGLKWVENHPRTFVYINKIGCHFPYERYSNNENKTNDSYTDCVSYTMTSYLSEFYSIRRTNDVLFYTSDHGQHLGENQDISLTHCARAEVHQSMASVPYLSIRDSNLIDPLANSNRPPTHQTLFYDVLEQLNPNYKSLYPIEISKNKVEFSSGDIFGRSQLYKHQFKFEQN